MPYVLFRTRSRSVKKRSGARLVRDLAKYRRFSTVLHRTYNICRLTVARGRKIVGWNGNSGYWILFRG